MIIVSKIPELLLLFLIRRMKSLALLVKSFLYYCLQHDLTPYSISMKVVSIIMILVVSFITIDVSYSQDWEENKDPATGEKYYVASASNSKQDLKTFSYNLVAFVSKEEKSLGLSTTFSSEIDPVREGQDTVLIEFTMSDKSVIPVNGNAGKFELDVTQPETSWEQTYFVPVDPALDMRILSGTIVEMSINNVLSSKIKEKNSKEIQKWILAIARKKIEP